MKTNNFDDKNTKYPDLYIHDDILYQFKFDRLNKELKLTFEKYATDKCFEIKFVNTIGFVMTSCDFWGKSPHINGLAYLSKKEWIIIPKLFERKNLDPESCNFLKEPKNYTEVMIEFISGDYLIIACEEIVADDNYWLLSRIYM